MCIRLYYEKAKRDSRFYAGKRVGEHYADLIVNDMIIIEVKASECLMPEHEAQLLNYLKATHIEVGALLNFGKNPEIKRKMFDNDLKK